MTSSWLMLSLTLACRCLLPPPSARRSRLAPSLEQTSHNCELLIAGRPVRVCVYMWELGIRHLRKISLLPLNKDGNDFAFVVGTNQLCLILYLQL